MLTTALVFRLAVVTELLALHVSSSISDSSDDADPDFSPYYKSTLTDGKWRRVFLVSPTSKRRGPQKRVLDDVLIHDYELPALYSKAEWGPYVRNSARICN
ncbi:hypothetical protein J6590_047283 [Homalodisca vitripennis]|nr:hypothetical protein J6590_047283 [Homalodisca vitripennis]